MFEAENKVRMNDTDMAGILFFANQFRFVHDAFEDFLESEGLNFQEMLQNRDFLFVIVHVEADYLEPIQIGDKLRIDLEIEKIGTSSFTTTYLIFKNDHLLVGKAKTVHVAIDYQSRKKIPIPLKIKNLLLKHLKENPIKIS